MAVDFAKLKKASGKASLESLTQELSKITSPQNDSKKGDDRFWQPTVDKAGNGYAVLRFLPAPGEEDVPFVRVFNHGFQGPGGKWYIENSLTTIGKPDPVSEYNTKLWNSGIEKDKETVRKQKRRLNFISNIYIVTDSGNPENEGKVFLFKYGKKIFDKLNEAMNPQFEDEKAINPFDLWSGTNFKLKIRNVEGYRNYDKSEFGNPEPLFDNDGELEKVWRKTHSLQEFVLPANFKSYDELNAKLLSVLEESTPAAKVRAAETEIPWATEEDEAPKFKTKAAKTAPVDDDDDDEAMSFFKKLAKE
jgi:hypothetical protein